MNCQIVAPNRRPSTSARLLSAAMLLAVAGPLAEAPLDAAPVVTAGNEWSAINGDSDETGFNRLGDVTAANVRRLDPFAIGMGRALFMASAVHEGTLMQRGMPRFNMFEKPMIEGLRQYIRAQARKALPSQR